MAKFIFLFATACAFSTKTHGLDVHCNSDETDIWTKSCKVKENLDIHEPTTLSFIDADDWDDVTLFEIPSHNNVSVIPSGIFTRFLKLTNLRISTGLKTIQKDDFKHAHAMTLLELRRNALEALDENVFSEAPNLAKIDLTYNRLTSIEDAFNGLTKLEYIWLQNNNLTSLKRNTFAGAEKLLAINLYSNQIETIEDGAFDLPNLQYLLLWDNSIHSLSDNVFVGAPKLIHISLAVNGLTHIGQSIYKSNSLYTVILDGNKIEDIDLVSFGRMPSLRSLSLKDTGFTFENIPESPVTVNSSVTDLNLAKNNLSDSDVLGYLERLGYINLRRLDLEENLFADIEGIDTIEQKFENIGQLGLSDNKFTCEWIERTIDILLLKTIYVINNFRDVPSDSKDYVGINCI